MSSKSLLFYCLLLFPFSLLAQIGGQQNFEFLRIPSNAHLAGLGGVNISSVAEDLDVYKILQNPALLNTEMDKSAALTYSNFFADINHTSLVYAHDLNKIGMLGFALQYLNYGQIEMTDATGLVLGTFNANDFALNLSYSYKQEHFNFGATLKFLSSQIESYKSTALAFDLGGIFKHPEQDLSLALTIKNIGFPISKFTPEQKLKLPFDVLLGTSFKPQYMPFRFSFTLHHLYRFDIVYLDPNVSLGLDANGNPIREKKKFFDKIARHVVLGGELIPAKSFQVLLGYNHLINRELRVQEAGGFSGFSFGFRLKVKSFAFVFSRATYHLTGARSFFTLSSNLGKTFKKKKQQFDN